MVKVYTRPGCVYCPQVKKWLKGKKIAFQEKEAEGPEWQRLATIHGVTVPLIVNGDKGMVGYNIPQLIRVVS